LRSQLLATSSGKFHLGRCLISPWRFAQADLQLGRDFSFIALEVARNSLHRAAVSKVEQMESELRKLSSTELRQIREWLDDFIEDELEFTPEFENSIQQSERDMAAGRAARVREPKGS
jgi:hypothetical protein